VVERARTSLVRAAAGGFAASVTGSVLSLVNVLVMSRVLGSSGRGHVAFLTTVAGLTTQLAALGIPRAAGNFAMQEPENQSRIEGTTLVLSVVAGFVAIGAVALLILLVPAAGGGIDPALRWLTLLSIPMLLVEAALLQIARSHYEFGAANAGWLVPPIVNATVNGALAATGLLTVGAAVATWIGGYILITVLIFTRLLRRGARFTRPDMPTARRLFHFGIRAHGGQAMLVGNYRMDQWILGAVASSKELGVYSVAVAWSETLFFLPTVVEVTQRPDLVLADPQQARRSAMTAVRFCLVLTLVGALALGLLAPVLCTTFFGEDFSGAVPQLRILLLGGFGTAVLKLLGNALTSQGYPLRETAAIGVAFVAIVILDATLIPAFGGTGAAWASLLAYSAGGIAVLAIFRRTLGGAWRELIPTREDARWVRDRLRAVRAARGSAPE
jgi:O-antigen/teichoic acid export membrane protein